ncbi:hypothetical protein PoB_006117100 [Plakobranchus ocellatus]|uniref:Uncharacterized protein n=1 Tax=Plakobranchus ocellatus TaxID=259542 RepID=A0AAV4CS91_9GAST|nr:hypothetical protein PoB_006117100 [Plakobranchus ocellatus]
MFDAEDPTNPYDNVEFPVRKPGTGTWPAGATATSGSSAGSGVKLLGVHGSHQTTGRSTLTAGPKLAPLVEVDGAEATETQRLLPPTSLALTNNSSSFSPSSPTAKGQTSQKQMVQNKAFSANSLPLSQKTVPAPNPNPIMPGVNASATSTTKSVSYSKYLDKISRFPYSLTLKRLVRFVLERFV